MSKKYRLLKDIKSHQIFPKGLSYLKSNDMIVDFLFDNHFSEYFEEIKEEYTFMYCMDKNLKKGDIIAFYKNMSKEEMFDSIFMKGEKKDLKY